MGHDIFVSYSNKDKAVADTIVASLEKIGIRCWYAPRDIKPSDDWGESIIKAIEKSKIFLLIFSENANQSRHVLDELILAINEEKTVLPFRVENLEPKGAMRLHLSSWHWLDAYDPSWENYIQKLIQTVSANLDVSIDEKSLEKPIQVPPASHKNGKKNFPKLITITMIGAVLITAGWFSWDRFFRDDSENMEEIPVVSEDIQEENTLGEWNEGCRIAYVSHLDDSFSIWLMKPDGTNITSITDGQSDDVFPKWSSNGEKIAFLSDRNDPGRENHEIYIVDVDGNNLGRFNEYSNDSEYYRQFVWSPVNDQIAYVSEDKGDADIFIGEPGSTLAITTDPNSDISPAWSPDGSRLAFVSDREGNKDIFVVDANGENLIQLTTSTADDIEPNWSPDGERIAFISDRSGDFDVHVMNADGSEVSQLTVLGNNHYPTWSGDGNMIAFYSDRTGTYDLYKINQDGSKPSKLVDATNTDLPDKPNDPYFSWSPDGTEIVVSKDSKIYIIKPVHNAYYYDQEVLATGWYPSWSPTCRRLE